MSGLLNNIGRNGLTSKSGFNLIFQRGAAQITSIHAIPYIRTPTSTINHSVEQSNLRKRLLGRPGVLGIKRGMISWFTEEGKHFAATVIEIDACEVVGHKTKETHGYFSVIMGHIDKLKNFDTRILPMFQNAGVTPKQQIREFRVRDEKGLIPLGAEIKADYFAVGQFVDVKGVSKGKGFQGVMKRHGFKGLGASHGVSRAHRSAGGMGGNQTPGRVLPGKKMPGRMGGKNATVFNNEVLFVDAEAGILVVKGQIPGPNKSFVKVADAVKAYGRSVNDLVREAAN
ncbi:mitochondrial 54S ribosomal protein YmL9 [Scheffersomyces amazonensis]|uniref:mitochondrial 54S ribosomal protein YmL9 n=1 Tax=Scheffersomyces amazonensis TaxID=1078765 RepID=UPI00315D42C4